jgi:hypothetical protein
MPLPISAGAFLRADLRPAGAIAESPAGPRKRRTGGPVVNGPYGGDRRFPVGEGLSAL